jgi:hypothetical protein
VVNGQRNKPPDGHGGGEEGRDWSGPHPWDDQTSHKKKKLRASWANRPCGLADWLIVFVLQKQREETFTQGSGTQRGWLHEERAETVKLSFFFLR